MSDKPIIAVDIDDVVAHTTDALRIWVNKAAGTSLTLDDYHVETPDGYWRHYENIWLMNGIDIKSLSTPPYDPSKTPMVPGALEALARLSENFNIIFVTSRDSKKEGETQEWFKNQLGYEVTVYFASAGHHSYGKGAPSKGEIAKRLGAKLLIDDNPEHVQSALDSGVDAILFGDYGWQIGAPEHMLRLRTWVDVTEHLSGRE